MRHRLSVPIFLQVPSSQGGLCFSDDKEELATFTTLFVSSHTINRYHLPPHSLVGGSPASFPPEILTERQAYIKCVRSIGRYNLSLLCLRCNMSLCLVKHPLQFISMFNIPQKFILLPSQHRQIVGSYACRKSGLHCASRFCGNTI